MSGFNSETICHRTFSFAPKVFNEKTKNQKQKQRTDNKKPKPNKMKQTTLENIPSGDLESIIIIFLSLSLKLFVISFSFQITENKTKPKPKQKATNQKWGTKDKRKNNDQHDALGCQSR